MPGPDISHRPADVDGSEEPGVEASASEPSPTFGGNAAITIATQVTVLVLGLAASALISRALGPSGRGAYYVPVTTVTVAFSLLHLSIEMATTYHFAERLIDLRRLARVAATWAVILGAVGLAALTGPYLVDPDHRFGDIRAADIALAALALPFMVHSTWLMNIFVLGGRLPRSQAATIVAAVFQTAALIGLGIANAFSPTSVLLVWVASAICTWMLLVVWSRSFAPARPTLDRATLRRVAGYGLRIHPGFIAFYLLLRSDVFLVNAELTLRDVGIYSLAVLFAELVWTLASALAVAGLPFQSTDDLDASRRAVFTTVRICLLVSGVLSIGSIATLWFVLPLLYGAEFSSAYGPMVALLPGVIAMTVVRPLWNWLLREGRPLRIVMLLGGGFALNVALNLLLLSRIGLYGASLASSTSYTLIALVLAAWTLRGTGHGPRALLPGRADLEAGRALLGKLRRRGTPAGPATGEVRP